MNHQEIFETWKRHRQQTEVPRDFAGKVMMRLRRGHAARPTAGQALLSSLGRWAARPWAKAALFALGISLGLVRILITVQLILLA